MSDAVRVFIIKTILEDLVSGKMDAIVEQARSFTKDAVNIVFNADTNEAERQLKNLKKTVDDVAKIDSSHITKSYKETSDAAKNLKEHVRGFAEQSKRASETVGGLFDKINAGRLVMGAAGAGLALYASQIVENFASFQLSIDLIEEKLGSASSALVNFAQQGGQVSGTMSIAGRAGLENYMAVTGYDANKIQPTIENAEKIMHSDFGRGLAQFGITNEKDLINALSKPLDETSDLGRVVKSKMPELFKAGTLQTEKIQVQNEQKYAFQSDQVIEAEARRRLGERAVETIAKDVKPDTGYLKAMGDMGVATDNFKTKLGSALEPGITLIANFVTNVLKMASAVPEFTILVGAIVSTGIALSTIGAILPLVSAGWATLTAVMEVNPLVLAATVIAVLIVGLIALEAKFHVFSKAWEVFAKSEIGSDLIDSVKSLLDYFGLLGKGDFLSSLIAGGEKVSAVITGIFNQIDAIYKLAKGGDIFGALKGGAELAFKLSPVGIAAAVAEGLMPQLSVQKNVHTILQDLKTIWQQLSQWIYSVIDPIIQLYNIIRDKIVNFLSYIWGGVQKLLEKVGISGGDLSGEALQDELKKQLTEKYPKASEEEIDFLAKYGAKYGAGEKNVDFKGVTATDLHIPEAELQDAMELGKKLGSGEAAEPQAKVPEDAAKEGFNNGLDEAAKDAAANTQDRMDKGYGGGSGFAQADWSIASPIKYAYSGLKGSLGGLYDYYTKNAIGGEVTKSGLAWVDKDEPIVPAEVSRSSELISRLREIASGGGSVGGAGGVVIEKVEINLQGQQDANSIADEIGRALETRLSDFNFGLRTEAFVHRADRGYKA